MLAAALSMAATTLPGPLLAAPGGPAQARPGAAYTLPSGAEVTLQEVVRDRPDAYGITWRYRFVMPALAERVPALPGAGADDAISEEDAAELGHLGLPGQQGPFAAGDFDDAELVTLEELEAEGAIDGRIVIDLGAELASDQPRTPADPEVLLQDNAHADLLWLCETVALPELPPPGDAGRPVSIVISVADRPVAFGEVAMDVVQQFEGFSPAEDGKSCNWEPW